MGIALYFPQDEFGKGQSNFDLAADYLELTAFFSADRIAFTTDLVNAEEIGAEEDYFDVDEEIPPMTEESHFTAEWLASHHIVFV